MLNSEELINKVKSYNKFLNPETLTKAYEFALKAHKTQKRDEGVPYIIHPIAVADILSDLKLIIIPIKITNVIKIKEPRKEYFIGFNSLFIIE